MRERDFIRLSSLPRFVFISNIERKKKEMIKRNERQYGIEMAAPFHKFLKSIYPKLEKIYALINARIDC